ncbi:hypothetical protein ACP4OV_019393 [Aristida adscensionis]
MIKCKVMSKSRQMSNQTSRATTCDVSHTQHHAAHIAYNAAYKEYDDIHSPSKSKEGEYIQIAFQSY